MQDIKDRQLCCQKAEVMPKPRPAGIEDKVCRAFKMKPGIPAASIGWEADVTAVIRRKPTSFEEYWRASQAWQRKGLTLGAGRALANAGFLTVEDLQSAQTNELAMIPRIGPKSLAILCSLKPE